MPERDTLLVAADTALAARQHLFKATADDTLDAAMVRAFIKQLSASKAAAEEADDRIAGLMRELATWEAKAAEAKAEMAAILGALPADVAAK